MLSYWQLKNVGRMFARLTILALTCLAAGCATPISSGSQCVVEPGYLADRVRFAWTAAEAVTLYDETGFVSPVTVAALEQQIVEHLGGKGFEYVANAADADFTLAVNLSTRRELVSATIDGVRSAERWEPVELSNGARFDLRTIGFLSADAFVDGRPIWRGWVERNLYPDDRDAAGAVIGEALPLLFATFPP